MYWSKMYQADTNKKWSKTKTSILKMMIEIGMGSNMLCTQCRSATNLRTNALGPWVTCQAPFRAGSVLFVGKVARGDCLGEEIADHLEDVTSFGESFIAESSWAYWSYTRAIIERVYGDLTTGIRHVSFTNIVKCNNETLQDTVDGTAKDFCIGKNRFIWKEVELIRPRLVIFYTHTGYDAFIREYRPSYGSSHIDNEDKQFTIGNKIMPWWDRSFFDDQPKEVLRFLRVGHPERKKKEDYVAAISKWITSHSQPINI